MRSYFQLCIKWLFLRVLLKILSPYFRQLGSVKNLTDNIWNFTPVTQERH